MSLHRNYSSLARVSLLFVVTALATGCSALIDADADRLPVEPGVDGGRVDGGPQDTGVPPTDEGVVPPDGGDVCAGGCDDGVRCTLDTCGTTGCVNTPTDGACGPAERCSVLMDCVPRLCESDASCDDGLYCDGEERCDVGGAGSNPATGCAPGVAPSCFDDFACTTDSCDETSEACIYVLDDAACDDGIACTADACDPATATTASGCVVSPDDSLCASACTTVGGNAAVRPGLCRPTSGGCTVGTAVACTDSNPCTADACTAGACTTIPVDADADGYPAQSVGGTACGGSDCNDAAGSVHPGAPEACNALDDNCNGAIDEGCPVGRPESCTTAVALTAGAGGVLSASGVFSDFADDYRSTCGAMGGRDAVYYFDVTTASDIVVRTSGGTADTVVAVGTECSAAGFAFGCDDDIAPGMSTLSRVFLHRVVPMAGGPPVRVYVLVDGYDGTATGAFTVSATISPAAADTCTAPIDISGGGTLVGIMGFGVGPAGPHGSCQPTTDWGDPEAVAVFAGSADGTQTFSAASGAFNPALYVRNAMCGNGASENSCVTGTAGGGGGTALLDATTPSGTRGYLFIDNGVSRARYMVDYTP